VSGLWVRVIKDFMRKMLDGRKDGWDNGKIIFTQSMINVKQHLGD
jgi:hypothetical protein